MTHASSDVVYLAWVQIFATVVVGCTAAYIAYRQWRTAHDRMLLALFDKRLDVYKKMRAAMRPIYAAGAAEQSDFFEFVEACEMIRFLFDDDVAKLASQTRQKINRLALDTKMVKLGLEGRRDIPRYQEHVESQYKIMNDLTLFTDDLEAVMSKYIRMTHKIPEPIWPRICKLARSIKLPRIPKMSEGD